MRRALVIASVALALCVIFSLLWPTPSYDLSRVHPRLRELSSPFRSVQTEYFLDGGSIGMTIFDRAGRVLRLALPIPENGRRTYPRLFIGTTDAKRTNAVEVEFTEDTRRMLISLIERHDSSGDGVAALMALRGAPRDYLRLLTHRYLGPSDQPSTTP